MNEEQIKERQAALLQQRQALFQRLEMLRAEVQRTEANISAHNGALEDCAYWLSQIQEEQSQEESDG